MKAFIISLTFILGFHGSAFAEDAPRVGRGAAAKYFDKQNPEEDPNYQSARVGASAGPEDHYLAIHLGKMMSSTSYEWGTVGKQDDVGDFTAGITYRIGEWRNSMDLNLRLDFIQYNIVADGERKPLKLSILPLITFPDATSKFPLYFGFGAGPGVFFRQAEGEASLSLDYQLVAGARFFDVFENAGFFLETGLKNHLQLWNSGQFNGTFLSAGAVFTF
ncbi:MAG: hypothetical protein H7326_06320 [Bdellovibrionaceae bacterium]|nr:hypothetical protein [Pseudobdellovibrionaceae bacterium]